MSNDLDGRLRQLAAEQAEASRQPLPWNEVVQRVTTNPSTTNWRTRIAVAAVTVGLVVGGFVWLVSWRSGPATIVSDDPSTDSDMPRSETTIVATTEGTPTTSTQPGLVPLHGRPFDDVAMVFDVEGVEVVTRVADDLLPEVTRQIRMTSYVIQESGALPIACTLPVDLGGVPRCSGVELAGLDLFQLEESSSIEEGPPGVRSAVLELELERNRTGVFEVITAEEPQGEDWEYRPEHPNSCGIESEPGDFATIGDYALNADVLAGGPFESSEGKPVLQVSDDPARHIEALHELGVADPCVIQVEANTRELLSTFSGLLSTAPRDLWIRSVNDGAYGRVDVEVWNADVTTVEAIAAMVPERSALRIIGRTSIG